MRTTVIKNFNFKCHELEHYLEQHPLFELNKRIYNEIVATGGSDFDIAEMFDEAYLICTKIHYDSFPANNFNNKYHIFDVNITSDYQRSLDCWTWWSVYFIIKYVYESYYGTDNVLKNRYWEFICCFRQTDVYNLFKLPGCRNIKYIDLLADCDTLDEYAPTMEEAQKLIWVEYDFPLNEIPDPHTIFNWEALTNSYERDIIEALIFSYETYADRKYVLDAIYLEWQESDKLPF